MYMEEFTITRHRNGYFEVKNCQGCLIQTADTQKEAENDIKREKNEVNFADVLQAAIAKRE